MFEARRGIGSVFTSLGQFCSAEEAARAYDDAAREAGSRIVNFPRPGTHEVQAVKGEMEELTLQRASGKRAPLRSGPLPPAPDYKGVRVDSSARTNAVFRANFKRGAGHGEIMLGSFCTAEEAARAHDDASRQAGRRVVNFPRPGTDEVQAVKGEKEAETLLRAAGERVPLRSGPPPPAPDYKGVVVAASARTTAVFQATVKVGGVRNFLGSFCTAEEAARAYDDAARKAGRRVVNFPRPGTDEVQAVKAEMDRTTLARHTAAQAAGGAGTTSTITPPGMASPPPKRRAAAPPPSEPPRKRVPSRGVKSPDAVKPEAPVAAAPAPYTRRPPHRIERESSLPPGFIAPATRIKTETPAAVKAETPAAPPMPAGWASPAPPSASAAPAPPVKMEHDHLASGAAFQHEGGAQ